MKRTKGFIKKIILCFIVTLFLLPNYIVKASVIKTDDTWKIDGQWELKVLGAVEHNDCDGFGGNPGSQVVMIYFHYKNIGYNGALGVYIDNVRDEVGDDAEEYMCEHQLSNATLYYVGSSVIVAKAYALQEVSEYISVTFVGDDTTFYDNATFEVPVTKEKPNFYYNDESILNSNKFNYRINDTWKVKDNWEYKITSVKTHHKCSDSIDNEYGEHVVIANYECKNIGYNGPLEIYFDQVYDEFGNIGRTYWCNHTSGIFDLTEANKSAKGSVAFILPKKSRYMYAIIGNFDNDGNYLYEKYVLSIDGNEIKVYERTPNLTVCELNKDVAWEYRNGKSYWYEKINGKYEHQAVPGDPKNIKGDGSERGREIYDPCSNGWYWLDTIYDGAKAEGKEVWVPYIYQDEDNWDNNTKRNIANESNEYTESDIRANMADQVYDAIINKKGKWVRYDSKGRMAKGWYTVEGDEARVYPNQIGNTYYYDYKTGLMAKGWTTINGINYYFNEVTGVLERQQ